MDNSLSALIINPERGDLGFVQMPIPGPFQPKDVGSSRTNMVVKILPTDGDNALPDTPYCLSESTQALQ